MTSIYKITNKINGNIYIGKTVEKVELRWKDHVYSALSQDKDGNCPFHLAIRKYGPETFQIETIEKCDDSIGPEREKYWIKYYNSYNNGYNATLGGDGNPLYDRGLIKKLWDEGLTNKEICTKLGCDKGTVRKALYSLGVAKEELLERKGKAIKAKIDLKFLEELWNQEYTVKQLSQFFGYNEKVISKKLDEIGVDSTQRHNRYYDSLLKVHWSKIIQLYQEGKTPSQIRDITGCSLNGVKKTILRHIV